MFLILQRPKRLWEYVLDLFIFSSVLSYTCFQKTTRYRWLHWYIVYLITLSAVAACMFGGLLQTTPIVRFTALVISDFSRVAVHPLLLLMVLVADSQWWRSLSDSIIRMGVRPSASQRKLNGFFTAEKRSRFCAHRHLHYSCSVSNISCNNTWFYLQGLR